MPYVGCDFPNATVGETVSYSLDFTYALADGELVSQCVVAASVAPDSEINDPNSARIVSGAAVIAGALVTQKFTNLVYGVKYLVTYTATTNNGNILIPFTHFFTDMPA